MNWLIYISGWFIGWAVWNGLINYTSKDKKEENAVTIVKLTIWTMMWIWVCWRFIK